MANLKLSDSNITGDSQMIASLNDSFFLAATGFLKIKLFFF